MPFAMECVVACALFTLAIKLASTGRREAFENDYPPVVTQRLREQGLLATRPPSRRGDVIRKVVAFVVFSVLFALVLRHTNGIRTFEQAALTSYAIWFVVDWYDFLVVDIALAPLDPFYRAAGVSALDPSAVRFHFLASLRGLATGIPFALVVGALVTLLP